MNDLRTGFIVEGVLCINVPVKTVLLTDIQRESECTSAQTLSPKGHLAHPFLPLSTPSPIGL